MPLPVFDPAHYATQLDEKIAGFAADFAAFSVPAPQVFASEPLHYRLRAEFRIWHHDGGFDYAMFDPDEPKRPVLMQGFPAACQRINAVMPALRERVLADAILKRRFYAVEFLATLAGDLLVTMIYHRPLDAEWDAAARQLEQQLGVAIIGRSRGRRHVLSRDWVEERLVLDDGERIWRQHEGGFTQPNGGVNRQMLGWARAQAGLVAEGGDLLELYCGNGNFTVALAPLFGKVLATEVSKTSVHAAEHNLAANGIGNTVLVRLSSEEVSAALSGQRAFRRLQDVDLTAYRFSTLFVDPPRSGLDPATLELAAGFANILYISCNPQTLRDNVAALADSHRVVATAVFDQFPYTHHLECGVRLQRRAN